MLITANKIGQWKRVYELIFLEKDLVGVDNPHNDTLVLTVNINTWDVMRVLIDLDSSSEVLYKNLYDKLEFSKNKIQSIDFTMFIFSGQSIWPIGTA